MEMQNGGSNSAEKFLNFLKNLGQSGPTSPKKCKDGNFSLILGLKIV